VPRTLGAWLAGALLGLAGAVAQGLFRNPLADPYLLGSASGAAFGVSVLLVVLGLTPAAGWLAQLGLTGAAFLGAMAAVAITLALARGVQQTLRLLLAGVIVGMVFGAFAALVMFLAPDVLRAMQAFLLGTTGFLGWSSVADAGPAVLALVPSGASPAAARSTPGARRDHGRQPGHRAGAGAHRAGRPDGAGDGRRRAPRRAGGLHRAGSRRTWCARWSSPPIAGCCRFPRWPAACCCWRPTCWRAGCWRRANCRWVC
jgi:hypothetical protein